MAGLACILKPGEQQSVSRMLDIISHRGKDHREIIETSFATIGIIWSAHENKWVHPQVKKHCFMDGPAACQCAKIKINGKRLIIYRDELGVAPMYYAHNPEGIRCFASEVKALIPYSDKISEMPPGHLFTDGDFARYFELKATETYEDNPRLIAQMLRKLLEEVILKRILSDTFGSWLSGGLDSSTIAAIAKPMVNTLHTFSVGIRNAPDLDYARMVAAYIESSHHERVVDLNEILKVIPDVIYHLESFDALLVRSSILNFIVAKTASDHVSEVFSGEAGDEFFAGYLYLKDIPAKKLDSELIDISSRLHNTAFQRVDRCASAHGTTAHVIFADPELFDFALGIPSRYKINFGIEKWILREAMVGMLPEKVLKRTKAKFWEGSGLGDLLAKYAAKQITDYDFRAEKNLPDGSMLSSKEELMYYRIFRERLGELKTLDWMGRTKTSALVV